MGKACLQNLLQMTGSCCQQKKKFNNKILFKRTLGAVCFFVKDQEIDFLPISQQINKVNSTSKGFSKSYWWKRKKYKYKSSQANKKMSQAEEVFLYGGKKDFPTIYTQGCLHKNDKFSKRKLEREGEMKQETKMRSVNSIILRAGAKGKTEWVFLLQPSCKC